MEKVQELCEQYGKLSDNALRHKSSKYWNSLIAVIGVYNVWHSISIFSSFRTVFNDMSQAMRKCALSYANNKGADQTAQMRSLISAFVVRCLDSIIIL